MTTTAITTARSEPQLLGHTVVMIAAAVPASGSTRAVNLTAPGFVDTPLSASLPAISLKRAAASLSIRRVAGPADVAALAAHLMTNTAATGGAYDIDGGQQLVSGSQGDLNE